MRRVSDVLSAESSPVRCHCGEAFIPSIPCVIAEHRFTVAGKAVNLLAITVVAVHLVIRGSDRLVLGFRIKRVRLDHWLDLVRYCCLGFLQFFAVDVPFGCGAIRGRLLLGLFGGGLLF
jgi:hypothetical protein